MGRETKIKESALYEVWKHQDFKNTLKTPDGEDVVILERGTLNHEHAGPDFRNARIRIGNLTYVGDIEIDCAYTDWKSHGHHLDSKYNKVVLHASFINKSNYSHVYTRDGRKVPSVCLNDFLDPKLIEGMKSELEETENNGGTSLKCHSINDAITPEQKEKILYELGVHRFEKKCKKIFSRLKELEFLREMKIKEPVVSYDLSNQFHEKNFTHKDFGSKEIWQQLLYELLFEALGYSKNKTQMMELAGRANVKFLSRIEKDGVIIEKYESVLFHVSGLIQNSTVAGEEQTKAYLERLNLHWNSLRALYDGALMDETEWHFFRLRPQNFPTVRIAGGAKLLFDLLHGEIIKIMIKKITEIHNLTVLINSLRSMFVVRADGYWRNHYIFDEPASSEIKYFVGASRADEIVVNVLIPFFAVYFDVFGNKNLSKKVFKMYTIFQQKAENQIITDVAGSLNLAESMKKTIIAQGMIELFRNLCSKNKCLECEIGKTVFS
ncbi:MAG: DUF2851 family protein [Ignavibacteriales bacterium]|nr:DUF2851 family protein [Ignavibacteriales bacterium]